METTNQIVNRLAKTWRLQHGEHVNGTLDSQEWMKARKSIIKEAKRLNVYGWVRDATEDK